MSENENETETAISKISKWADKPSPSDGIRPIIPQSLEETFRYAQVVCKAGLAPSSYNLDPQNKNSEADPQKVVIGIMKGMEVGLPPMSALSNIAIINNRPSIWGDGAIGLIQSQGLLESMEVIRHGEMAPGKEPSIADYPDDYGYTIRMWRKGQSEPYEGTFTVRDAKRAHLWGNKNKKPWIEYPDRMLYNRARSYPIRDGFADVLVGLAIAEEARDIEERTEAPKDTSFLNDDEGEAPAEDETPQIEQQATPEMPDIETPEPVAAEDQAVAERTLEGEAETVPEESGTEAAQEPYQDDTPAEPEPEPDASEAPAQPESEDGTWMVLGVGGEVVAEAGSDSEFVFELTQVIEATEDAEEKHRIFAANQALIDLLPEYLQEQARDVFHVEQPADSNQSVYDDLVSRIENATTVAQVNHRTEMAKDAVQNLPADKRKAFYARVNQRLTELKRG